MAKEDKNINPAAQQQSAQPPTGGTAEGATTPAGRPNRDAYAKMYAEDYPDADFEDKESRYGNLINDRKHLREYTQAGRGLSDIMDKNPWLGAMINELRENPDLDPFTWMAQNGIDITEALENEEYRKKISQLLEEHQKKQAEGEKHAEQVSENMESNAGANLQKVQQKYGFDNDTANQMFRDLFEKIADPAFEGNVSEDVWEMIYKGMHYDDDVASAREEGGMQARNEKMQNKVKNFSSEVPPTLSQGGNGKVQKPEKKTSFFDDLQDYH